MLGTLAVIAAIGITAWNFDLESSTPPAARIPLKPLAEPVRDTSAPAVKARGLSSASAKAAAGKPLDARAAPITAAEPSPVAATTATLHITSDVPGAEVFIDRKYIGVAPVTANDIAPGSRRINVSAAGYDGVAETFDVAPGPRNIMISLKTIRLDESIPVTHKHGMGSCAGRLVATPEGMRYQTENKNDGFSVPLTALETFTMDFLAKNLKVKIKGGRSYDFTDPEGKADPLYFFHQAVDKARLKQAAR